MITVYCDAEDLAKAWLVTTSVAALANNKVFLAMPKGSPLPSVILNRVGGAPDRGSDVPSDVARISFACWASDRPTAKAIAKALVSEAENLARTTSFVSVPLGGRLNVAETLSWIWLPDALSDTPRYIVDILFTITTL